jgi:hypothetical protein
MLDHEVNQKLSIPDSEKVRKASRTLMRSTHVRGFVALAADNSMWCCPLASVQWYLVQIL